MMSSSSRRIKNEFRETRQYLWSKSYCLVTTGGATLEVVKQYM